MTKSNKSEIWNKRKGETKKNDDELMKDEIMAGDPGEHNDIIERVQHRLGVSREEAKRIIRNSEWI